MPRIERRVRVSGVTLVEIITVLIIIGVMSSIAYPSISRYSSGRQVAGAALEIISSLSLARGLSVARADARVYGVVFFKDGLYSVYSFVQGNQVSAKLLDDSSAASRYGERQKLPASVEIMNFSKNGGRPLIIVFRPDGVPTDDGKTFPISDEASHVVLSSLAIDRVETVYVNKTTGFAGVK